jgi:outer membrane protein
MKAFALVVLLFISTVSSAENIKIGYIDVDLVINSLTKFQEDNEVIILNFQPKKLELLQLFDHIEKLKLQLIESKNSLSNEDYNKQIEVIMKLEASFKNETEQWQNALNQKQANSLEKIEKLINQAIKDLAVKENYDLILYTNAAYVSEKLNISDKIIFEIEKL